jgi:hypothetical protein
LIGSGRRAVPPPASFERVGDRGRAMLDRLARQDGPAVMHLGHGRLNQRHDRFDPAELTLHGRTK